MGAPQHYCLTGTESLKLQGCPVNEETLERMKAHKGTDLGDMAGNALSATLLARLQFAFCLCMPWRSATEHRTEVVMNVCGAILNCE